MVYPCLTKKQLKTHYRLIKREHGLAIKESPCIVCDRIGASNFNGKWAGVYIERGPFSDAAIFVDMFLPNYQKLSTAYHEIGHHICHEDGCYCQDRPATNEAHADRYTLQVLLDNELYSVALDYMIDLCVRINEWKGMYHNGAKQLRKFAIWEDARSILLHELRQHMKRRLLPEQVIRNLSATSYLLKFRRTK